MATTIPLAPLPGGDAARSLLFQPGPMRTTRQTMSLLVQADASPQQLVRRHLSGDFGDLDAQAIVANRHAIREGRAVRSTYRLDGQAIHVITEPGTGTLVVVDGDPSVPH